MNPRMLASTRLAVMTCLATTVATAILLAQSTTRVSLSSQGAEGNDVSWKSAISADGRHIGFLSSASNLVADDTNGIEDVFVHDMDTGVTTRVNVDSQGQQAIGWGWGWSPPVLSADGRYVAFESTADNLVAGDTNDQTDVFVHDMKTRKTTRVSVNSLGEQANDGSGFPSISADGRYVAFHSYASNLAAGDTNDRSDVFIHDRLIGSTTLVSLNSQGEQSLNDCVNPALSADGRWIAFETNGGDLVPGDTNGQVDVFLRSLDAGTTTRVSVTSLGEQADFNSINAVISANGRFVAFESIATDLVPDDTNLVWDIFVHDLETGTTTRVSVDSSGAQADRYSELATISADGRFIAFRSDADNLVPADTNNTHDMFVHDCKTGETTRVSVSSSGAQANSWSGYQLSGPAISGNGRYVAFDSNASNLVPGDTNGTIDLFVRDRNVAPCSTPAFAINYGSGWPGTRGVPELVATTEPLLCAPVEITIGNSSGTDTTAVLFVGTSSANY
ncbi:MAG: hypothetical protein U1E76_06135, partial [Planctomycetota bacterium]